MLGQPYDHLFNDTPAVAGHTTSDASGSTKRDADVGASEAVNAPDDKKYKSENNSRGHQPAAHDWQEFFREQQNRQEHMMRTQQQQYQEWAQGMQAALQTALTQFAMAVTTASAAQSAGAGAPAPAMASPSAPPAATASAATSGVTSGAGPADVGQPSVTTLVDPSMPPQEVIDEKVRDSIAKHIKKVRAHSGRSFQKTPQGQGACREERPGFEDYGRGLPPLPAGDEALQVSH